MGQLEKLFEQYTDLRLNGKSQEVVFKLMRDAVISNLNREERNTLAIRCKQWENERTQPNLSDIQRQALKRAALTNITLKIVFCPACDSPNGNGVTRCQVCDEPLAVAHVQKNATTGIHGAQKGTIFERDAVLELRYVNSNDRLKIQPQISTTGIKVGRTVAGSTCDVDLTPLGASDYGISRVHAVIRFDKSHDRVVLIDNNSTNGTFVNGVQIPPHQETTIADGDDIKFARMHFVAMFK